MSWSNNNLAHIYTNGALVSLKQYKAKVFDQAGAIKVRDMKFFPGAGATDKLKNTAAMSLASAIDGIMNQWVNGTQYEEGFGPSKTIKQIAAVLGDGDKTVADVGAAVDACFFFAGEFHDA